MHAYLQDGISFRETDSARIIGAKPRCRNASARTIARREEKNHIDPREPYTPRRRRLRINKDFPSRAFRVERENISNIQATLRFSPPLLAPTLIRTFIISLREKHFLSTALPAPLASDTVCKLSSLLPYNLSQPLLLLLRRPFSLPLATRRTRMNT